MESASDQLRENGRNVKEFNIPEENLSKETNKRKNWTAPGIDGIQNFWWKRLKPARKALKRAFEKNKNGNKLIPVWWPTGRTVLLPKTKDLSHEKNYRPITCLNTSYKLLTRLFGKYMRQHAIDNEIWDEGQLGAVAGVFGTVDQLIIDRSIMEEVMTYNRNRAVAFYDNKKAYDKVHHDWMLRVYTWIGIPGNVTALFSELMRNWKTRLETWKDGEKRVSRWIEIMCGFLQGDSYSPFGFCLSEVPLCKLLRKNRNNTVWVSQETEMLNVLIACL